MTHLMSRLEQWDRSVKLESKTHLMDLERQGLKGGGVVVCCDGVLHDARGMSRHITMGIIEY